MPRLVGGILFFWVAACATPTAATTTTAAPATTTSAAPQSGFEAVDMFASCMEAAGFDLGQLTVDDEGRPDLGALSGEAATEPAFRQAVTLCAGPLSDFLSLEDTPGLEVMVRAQLQDYASCMRASGVEDFPDPAPDFDGSFNPFPSEQIPTGDPEFGPAVEACAAALGVNGE